MTTGGACGTDMLCTPVTAGNWEARAYTRLFLSSSKAVSDSKCTLNTPQYPLTPPKHPNNNL